MHILKGKEDNPLHIALDVSHDDIGKDHKAYYLMLAILPHNTVASIEMMSHQWGKKVGDVVGKRVV